MVSTDPPLGRHKLHRLTTAAAMGLSSAATAVSITATCTMPSTTESTEVRLVWEFHPHQNMYFSVSKTQTLEINDWRSAFKRVCLTTDIHVNGCHQQYFLRAWHCFIYSLSILRQKIWCKGGKMQGKLFLSNCSSCHSCQNFDVKLWI